MEVDRQEKRGGGGVGDEEVSGERGEEREGHGGEEEEREQFPAGGETDENFTH